MAGVHLKMGLLQCSTLYLSLFFLKLAQNASWRSRDISFNLLSVLASRTPALPAGTVGFWPQAQREAAPTGGSPHGRTEGRRIHDVPRRGERAEGLWGPRGFAVPVLLCHSPL